MIKIIVGFILSFLISLILMPIIIKLNKKLSCAQTILKWVEEHKNKQGTPTMGGVVFYISTLIVVVCLLKYSTELAMCIGVGIGFALIGFLDDFIKIRYKQNQGLLPYQKIIGQVGIAVIFACYIYFFSQTGGKIYLPFTFHEIDLGFWIIPLIVFVCLATTNAVNLTDGLDGLASGVSEVFFAVIIFILTIFVNKFYNLGVDERLLTIYSDVAILSAIFLGSIMAFLVFNTNKASIFMGDVGSLGIGGLIASICCVTGFELFIPILGFMFVVSTISVIMQVVYFKKTRKRIFKMAPIHHHFQMTGYSEAKIGYVYKIITLMLGLITIVFTLYFV